MVKVKCCICGKELNRKPSQIKNSKYRRFFCKEHINMGNKRPDLKKYNDNRKMGEVERTCLNCGKKFKVRKSMLKYHDPKYCSQLCYHAHTPHNRSKGKTWKLPKEFSIKLSERQLGEKNHNWKGGGVRRPKQSYLRKKVIDRDNYKCVICGASGTPNYRGKPVKGLVAHHLESYDKNKDLRWDEDNMITLCDKCHKDFHKKYGYGNNTKKQFKEWSKNRMLLEIKDIKNITLNSAKIYNISLDGDDTFFANGIFTHNTPPHIIKPKNKKALAFKGKDGETVFTKKVNHPGTRPNPFIRNTIYKKLNKIINEEVSR